MKKILTRVPAVPHAAIASLLLLFAPVAASAQTAPAPAPDAATLARYDTNRNGRLDPDELRAMEADMRRATAASETADETVQLSPFQVVADTRGYYAANTMSGTRLNTKLEDLASSITVMTKEQMSDFALLDINDVFLYAGNTEGTGTYTEFSIDDGQGALNDATAGDPGNANRVRGIGRANVSVSNFESSNRVPLDPIDADAVEVSRGPNANIFGLGNASGTVNIVGATANLRRDRATLGFRADSFDGYRASLDVNRVLFQDKLALRASTVQQRDGYNLKPSGVYSKRYNAMVQYRPFKTTTLHTSYQIYRGHGNRPNSTTPMDGFSAWLAAGAQTWDPVTNTRKLNGVSQGSSAPSYLYAASSNFAAFYVEPDGSVPVWMTTWGTTGGRSPLTDPTQSTRKMYLTRALTSSQPLIGRRVDMISDKSIYDWSSINLAAPNRFKDATETARITLEQVVFNTSRQSLAAQLGFFREDSERFQRYLLNDGATSGPTGQMVIDVNERLLDGSPNPGFMRPLLQVATPGHRRQPIQNKTYRGQFAYMHDFTVNNDFRRWLGWHGLTGYGEFKERISRSFRFYDQIISDNPWMLDANGNVRLHSRARPAVRWYLGDAQGFNVDYAPGNYAYGDYPFVWGDAIAPGGLMRETATLGEIPTTSASGSRTLQKTRGAILQSKLFNERIVTTFGRREDESFTKFQNPARTTNRGLSFDYDYMTQWRDEDWQYRDGSTEQRGVVVRPLRGWSFIDERARHGSGAGRLMAAALRNMSVHYNESDSFLPASPGMNVYGEWLPDPSGFGKDYGVAFNNLFDGKLTIRVNKYKTEQLNSRSGPSAGFARSLWNLDFNDRNVGLQYQATEWITEMALAQGRTLTPQQLNAELERVMGTPPRDVPATGTITTAETDDIVSSGHEVEIHFNPTRYWTVAASFTEKQTINTRLARNVSQYITERMPMWTTVVDPRSGQLWWRSNYNNYAETPEVYFNRLVGNPLKIATATEGLSRPQIRRYSGNLSTNLRLAGITEHNILRRFNVGGALRYESKGAIGYWGVQQLPALITDFDINRPIWDKAHVYVDGFVAYRTRFWSEKIGATFQLNVRNIQESGRLQPIAAGPEGKLTAFRIISPRQFILSATFEL
jgi:hypothetical protein